MNEEDPRAMGNWQHATEITFTHEYYSLVVDAIVCGSAEEVDRGGHAIIERNWIWSFRRQTVPTGDKTVTKKRITHFYGRIHEGDYGYKPSK